MLDRQMMGGATRTVVPEIMYREDKALYLELRAADDGGVGQSRGTRDPTAEVDSPSHVGSDPIGFRSHRFPGFATYTIG